MIPILLLIVITLAVIVTIITLNFLRRQKERLKQQQADPAYRVPNATPPPTAQESFKNFTSLSIPRKDYFITPVIVDLNITIF